jgi:type VI secretion system secreted protein VgrG
LDSASAFLRVLRHEQSLSTAHRALRLRLAHAEGLEGEVLLPQQITGTESICGGLEYRVACVSSDPALPLKRFIALPAEVQIVTDRGALRSVCGIVTEARSGDSDGGLTTYQLVLRDALAIMEKRVNSRLFRNQNELGIVQVLFDEWRHANAVLAGAFEYELDPLLELARGSASNSASYPAREQTMQYNESDAAFVRRLLRRRGISWCVRAGRSRGSAVDPAHDRIPAHTLVLFADAAKLPQNAAGTVRYHRDGATERRDTITAWSAARSLQPGTASRHSWDYKQPASSQFMATGARGEIDQGGHGNALAASLDDYLIEAPHAGNDVEDSLRLGQLRMARHGFAAKCFHGEGTVRDFCAGQYFTLAGHPEIDTHPENERAFLITELQASVRNNLPGDMSARIESLLAKSGWGAPLGSAQVAVRFTAVRRGVPLVPAFDARVDLPHPQLQSAIVVGPAGEEVHCDSLGRVKIRFPGMRTRDHEHAHGAGASNSPLDSAWVRVASNWAGNGPGSDRQCGTLGLPRVGSEVLVAFLGGDPDKPIVLAQLFNGQALPPALSPDGGLPGNRYLSGLRSREVAGQRGSQLRFDDTRGQISAQLASDHAASELNLGWLTRPRANGEGEARGEGAELRSDHHVAIRGRQGVLVSAEAAQGDGRQLARGSLIGLTELMQSVVDEMAKLAEQHAGDEPGSGRLAELVGKLRHWEDGSNTAPGAKGAAPIVAVTAPAGMVLASQDNVALGSEKKVDVVSGGDVEIAAGRNVFVRAARGISAFAHALGIKLVAARGNVTLEAHQGSVEIKSSSRISLISSEAIHIEAPIVRIVSKGAQTEWADGAIGQQSSGKHVVRAASIVHGGPGGGNPAPLDFASSKIRTDERLVLRHMQTRDPIPHQRYIAHLEDGSTIDGISDEGGRTALVNSATLGPVRFELLP